MTADKVTVENSCLPARTSDTFCFLVCYNLLLTYYVNETLSETTYTSSVK